MTKTIEQVVQFPVSAATLYEYYMDAKQHTKLTGAPATIEPEVGGSFSAYAGSLSGHMLELVPGRLIVQAWRAGNFKADELDSVLVLRFRDLEVGGAEVAMTHVGVPDHCYDSIENGWRQYYWEKWRKASKEGL